MSRKNLIARVALISLLAVGSAVAAAPAAEARGFGGAHFHLPGSNGGFRHGGFDGFHGGYRWGGYRHGWGFRGVGFGFGGYGYPGYYGAGYGGCYGSGVCGNGCAYGYGPSGYAY